MGARSRALRVAPVWSPDGRLLATLDTEGDLTIGDAVSGTETQAEVPPGIYVAAWAPDSDRLLMFAMGDDSYPQAFRLSVISADGTGLTSLGDGDDFDWMPAPTAPAP